MTEIEDLAVFTAKEVMGWHKDVRWSIQTIREEWWCDKNDKAIIRVFEWSSAEKVEQAHIVLKVMGEDGWKFNIYLRPKAVLVSGWNPKNKQSGESRAPIDQPALAIMRAVVKAVKAAKDK